MAQEREGREEIEEGWLLRSWFKFKRWCKRYRVWVIVIVLALSILMGVVFGIALSKILPKIVSSGMATLVGVLSGAALTVLIAALWLRRCIRQVGTAESPAQAVIARFAKPVDAVGPGLIVIFWPFEEMKDYPTRQFRMNYELKEGLYTKANPKEQLSSLPVVSLKATIYMWLPKVDEYYSIPMPKDQAKESYKKERGETEPDEGKLNKLLDERKVPDQENLFWGRISGKELLLTAYLRLPFKDFKSPGIDEEITKHFEGAVEGALRYAIGIRDADQCKVERAKIAEEVGKSLIIEETSLFRVSGIPKECLDIEIRDITFPKDIEEAWRALEIASRVAKGEAEAMRITGEGMEKPGYKDVDKDVAAMLAKGKEPIVIKYKGGGGSGGLMDLGFQLEMGRQVAQKRMPAGRRSLEPGEEKAGEEKSYYTREEEAYYTRPERGLEVARRLAAEAEREEREKREKKKREKKR